jgi:hypothetical protein
MLSPIHASCGYFCVQSTELLSIRVREWIRHMKFSHALRYYVKVHYADDITYKHSLFL